MSVYKPDGAKTYRYDFWRKGKRYSGSTPCAAKRDAVNWERALIRETEAHLAKGEAPSHAALSLFDAGVRHHEEVCQYGASPDADLKSIARLTSLIGPDLPVDRITDAELAAAVAKRRAQFRKGLSKLGTVSAGTVNRTLAELAMVYGEDFTSPASGSVCGEAGPMQHV